MADPLSIAAAALAVASAAIQVLSKVVNRKNTNGYGKALADLELKITNSRRNEMDTLEDTVTARLHSIGNRLSEIGLRHDLKLNELDTEIKLIKQILTRDEKKRG